MTIMLTTIMTMMITISETLKNESSESRMKYKECRPHKNTVTSLNCSRWSDCLSVSGFSTTKKSKLMKLSRQKNWN